MLLPNIKEIDDFYLFQRKEEGNLLHLAARNNRTDLADAVYDLWGKLFLIQQSSFKHKMDFATLISSIWGPVVDYRNLQGWTALHCACVYGHLEMVEWLVKRFAATEALTKVTLQAKCPSFFYFNTC